jgi:chromate reductase, NAD(P)H dehydrogenase (quinone)
VASRPPRILAFAGSLRKSSLNRRLLRYASDGARAAGALVEELPPEFLQLPLYNGDLEGNGRYPADVETWRAQIREADGLLIASPEYNHGVSGVLKNAIDWGSRPPNVFGGKVAASFGTTTGVYGSARSQMSLRLILTPLGVWVVPKTVLIPHANHAFDETGELKEPKLRDELAAVGRILAGAIQAGLGRLA